MANDFDAELDSIFGEREARVVKARQQVAQQTAATAAFAKAWDQLCTGVVMPAFNEIAGALARRGVKADIGELDYGVRLYLHVNAVHLGRGRERDGQPYLAIRADASTQRIHFERSMSGLGRSDGIGDMPFDEVDADTVKTKSLMLIRNLFSDH
jgi:hypothetical protein